MNTFTVIDDSGWAHRITTCLVCHCLVEEDQTTEHIRQCARVYALTSPAATGVPM